MAARGQPVLPALTARLEYIVCLARPSQTDKSARRARRGHPAHTEPAVSLLFYTTKFYSILFLRQS